jgi:hypothetical protein
MNEWNNHDNNNNNNNNNNNRKQEKSNGTVGLGLLLSAWLSRMGTNMLCVIQKVTHAKTNNNGE